MSQKSVPKAFARPACMGSGGNVLHGSQEGADLRDLFAAAALSGMLAYPHCTGTATEIANWSYEFADAMLERRKT